MEAAGSRVMYTPVPSADTRHPDSAIIPNQIYAKNVNEIKLGQKDQIKVEE